VTAPPAEGAAPAPLSRLERAVLLGVARAALRQYLGLGAPPEIPEAGALARPRGAFVTLRVGGELRGCIGTFASKDGLARTVAEMAVAAATRDPRFPPLRAEELGELDVRISALGPMRPMGRPSEIAIGRDGVSVRRGWHRGTLLPSVAAESGWDAETFLARTCLKAGLPPDAWREPDAVVELYAAEEMGDPEDGA